MVSETLQFLQSNNYFLSWQLFTNAGNLVLGVWGRKQNSFRWLSKDIFALSLQTPVCALFFASELRGFYLRNRCKDESSLQDRAEVSASRCRFVTRCTINISVVFTDSLQARDLAIVSVNLNARLSWTINNNIVRSEGNYNFYQSELVTYTVEVDDIINYRYG